jgi:phosphoribosylformylglycinamidine synthase
MVMADTAQRPGGDAAVVRIHKSNRALAISTDVTPRYVKADPFEGGKQAVAETWRNITAVGARPLAITDNLNFGNPQKPEIMGQIVEAVKGIGEACKALDYPVISGNVSLYNETDGNPILPTPAIGGVGLLDNLDRMATIAFKTAGEAIIVLGQAGEGWLGQSLYLREVCGEEKGAPPPVDLQHERTVGDCVRGLITGGKVSACHDLSDGGLMVALAEMALAGHMGCKLEGIEGHAALFGEDQSRYVVTAKNAAAVIEAAKKAGVTAQQIGMTGGEAISLGGESLDLASLRNLHEGWFPAYMAQ